MTGILEKRIEALEARQNAKPATIICVIIVPGSEDAETGSADVGGRTMRRADDETGEAFLSRVEAEAELAARPGCSRFAMVWPQVDPSCSAPP